MEKGLQQQVFEKLKAEQNGSEIVSQLMDILSLSRASVYKRMKNEIGLTLEEFEKIRDHFELDLLPPKKVRPGQVIMHLPEKADDKDPILHFLRPIRHQLDILAKNEDASVRFLAVSFPVFYTFLYPVLALFKFLVYKNSVWIPSHAKIPPLAISSMARNQEYINTFSAIRDLYGRIDSTEVWTSDFFQSTINELKFYLECNLFAEPSEALVIMDKLRMCIENISGMAEKGNKSIMTRHPEKEEGGRFSLFVNDSGHFGSTILALSGDIKQVYLTYDQPNYLFSNDPVLFEDSRTWSKKVVDQSTPISDLGKMEKIKFFNQIREKIKQERDAIESLVN
ncbi:MAG: hypothetical protein HKN16_09335 [Saprospiraceae bacterium]|nr:hypothetical protein [Saprospiraceae bacterium]